MAPRLPEALDAVEELQPIDRTEVGSLAASAEADLLAYPEPTVVEPARQPVTLAVACALTVLLIMFWPGAAAIWIFAGALVVACAGATAKAPDSTKLSYDLDFVHVCSLSDGIESRVSLPRFKVRTAVTECSDEGETAMAQLHDGRRIALTQATDSECARIAAANFERWLEA